MSDLDFMTATELRFLVASRAVSPVELTERALRRAEATQTTLNAFASLMTEAALASARLAETAVMRGSNLGLLHVLPVSVKDLIPVFGQPWESGSRTMAGTIASIDAPSVERLRAQGAIIIGKTTTSEFGCKAVGDSPATGVTRNPWNLDKTPGGSSGGAAASVAAGITSLAVGTDGGGSLRIPAALTGLVGFKAQFGRVPIWPTTATPTLVHVGALARNVADAALLTCAIAGLDPRDPTSVAGSAPDLMGATNASVKRLRVAWSATLGYADSDPEVVAIARACAMALADQGAFIEGFESIFDDDPAPIWASEFYTGVAMRLRPTLESAKEMLDQAIVENLESALRQDLVAYQARVIERFDVRDKVRNLFERFDLLVSPTLPVFGFDIGLNAPARLRHRGPIAWSSYSYPFNLTGQPALSLCAGFGTDSLPVGVQIVGPSMGEELVVRAAAALERMKPAGYNLTGAL